MKTGIERDFLHRKRYSLIYDSLDEFALIPADYLKRVARVDGCISMVYNIWHIPTHQIAGEIALRIGEGEAIYYLGHIGYHIDPPFRGHHGALKACKMVLPILRKMGLRSFTITTDVDNNASIRTCELLGCTRESVVPVPLWCSTEFQMSDQKIRFVYTFE